MHVVRLPGPDGSDVTVQPGVEVELDQWYTRYCRTGLISPSASPVRVGVRRQQVMPTLTRTAATKIVKKIVTNQRQATNPSRQPGQLKSRRMVGRSASDFTGVISSVLSTTSYPISNGIGVGILSYNRAGSLRRLVNSIARFTDVNRTTVFISDDCSTDPETVKLIDNLSTFGHFTVIKNSERLGVAGNANRLMRCLSRFKHCLLLNDDVEIMSAGWDSFYPDAAKATGHVHFSHRQVGVYGAEAGRRSVVNGVALTTVDERPHGAFLYYAGSIVPEVGYMDEGYGLYGMEHVDWSMRPAEAHLQPAGFHDVDGSSKFIKVHGEASAVESRGTLLGEARERFKARKPFQSLGTKPSPRSEVPKVSVVIPFREIDRLDALRTVVNNVRAQRFPQIDIVTSEHDAGSKVNLSDLSPVTHCFTANAGPFNKSVAFNVGVSKVSGRVILHDADILMPAGYVATVNAKLDGCEACHVGKRVVYADEPSTALICDDGQVTRDKVGCERAVDYFEGGSTACTTDAYWAIGGHDERFVGYGCEDCDFFARLSRSGQTWVEDRTVDFLHLWHPRSTGWHVEHMANRRLEESFGARPIEDRIAECKSITASKYDK